MLRKTNIASALIFLTIVPITAGCGMFSTKNKGEKARENDNALTGQWRNGCSKLDWLGFAYHQETLKFSAIGDCDRVTTLFSDSSCTNATATLSERGTYASLGASRVAAGAQDINFTVTQATVTADSDDAVSLLNNASYCGISTWQKNQAVDVMGKTCDGSNHPKGEVIFDVYRVDNDSKRLETGKGTLFVDKSDANSRPGKLDDAHPYLRQ